MAVKDGLEKITGEVEFPDIVISGNGVPTGVVEMFAGESAPEGYLICDGSAVSRDTYSELFTTINTKYGAGDGSTTFNVPDLRQKFPVGKSASGPTDELGNTGGSFDHNHNVAGHYHSSGTLSVGSGGSHTHGRGTLSNSSQSNHSHSISGSTNTTGNHRHGIGTDLICDGGSVNNRWSQRRNGTPTLRELNSDSQPLVSTTGNHSHSVSGSTSSTGGHTHSISGSTASGGSHNHSLSGSVGNTSGENGNSNIQTSDSNPPYIVLNFIIKY